MQCRLPRTLDTEIELLFVIELLYQERENIVLGLFIAVILAFNELVGEEAPVQGRLPIQWLDYC